MRAKILLLIGFWLVISCNDESIDNRQDWVQEIDKTISDFEKAKIIFKKEELYENKERAICTVYRAEKSSIKEYVLESELGDVYPLKIEIFLKGNDVLYTKWSGLSPYINKGIVNEDTKCCNFFERDIYIKNSNEAIIFERGSDIKSIDEYDEIKTKIEDILFEEKPLEDVQNHINRTMKIVNEIRTKLVNL